MTQIRVTVRRWQTADRGGRAAAGGGLELDIDGHGTTQTYGSAISTSPARWSSSTSPPPAHPHQPMP
ncbi:hypothetical protein GS940_21915 [Rhodococcus hoagii]|nr:hypothetical protein [Prescottella equi]